MLYELSFIVIGIFIGAKIEDLRNDYLIRKSEEEGTDQWDK